MTTSDAILSVRSKLDDDTSGAKSVLNENLSKSAVGNQVGGGNKSFVLNNKRVIGASGATPSTLAVMVEDSVVSVASEDNVRGRFTLTNAPTTSCFATYDFQFFTDAELTQIVNDALGFVSVTDISQMDPGLKDALVYKAASDAAFKIASRTGQYYDQSAGGKSARKSTISDKFRQLAKDLFERATAERTAFYGERKGAATAQASGRITLKDRPYQPRR